MSRTYTKSKRADQEAETKLRITEAALALHGEVGPAQTTISMIADRAGVQRHTVYAHFPDERSVLMACSGLHLEREPLPQVDLWSKLEDRVARLQAGLGALYGWYARNQSVVAAVLRDAEYHALLREISDLRFASPMGAIYASLAQGLGPRGQTSLTLALNFYTWRTLTRDAGASDADAAALMAKTVLCADH